MTTPKAIEKLDMLLKHIQHIDDAFEAIEHAIETLKRFDGAVEVVPTIDRYEFTTVRLAKEPWTELESEEYNIYAIPKKDS
jgi:tRNA A58 N-methylase Trm61